MQLVPWQKNLLGRPSRRPAKQQPLSWPNVWSPSEAEPEAAIAETSQTILSLFRADGSGRSLSRPITP